MATPSFPSDKLVLRLGPRGLPLRPSLGDDGSCRTASMYGRKLVLTSHALPRLGRSA